MQACRRALRPVPPDRDRVWQRREFQRGRNTPDIPERFEREQAQHFNAVPWDWGAPGKVIAYRAGAAAQTAGDVGGR